MEVKLITDYDSIDFEIKVNKVCKEYESSNLEIDYRMCCDTRYDLIHYTALIKITPKQPKINSIQIK